MLAKTDTTHFSEDYVRQTVGKNLTDLLTHCLDSDDGVRAAAHHIILEHARLREGADRRHRAQSDDRHLVNWQSDTYNLEVYDTVHKPSRAAPAMADEASASGLGIAACQILT